MSTKWYYVDSGERKGPVEESVMLERINSGDLTAEDFVWRKGFDNWMKLHSVEEFSVSNDQTQIINRDEIPQTYSMSDLSRGTNSIFIKIGADRGVKDVEYGPYSIQVIQKLYDEKRINNKTYVFIEGMKNWIMLAEFEDYEEVFHNEPPIIDESEKRNSVRKPFIARMYIENNKEVFVGVCRDISIGGMQVLVDDFPGSEGDKISINVHPENTDYNFVASGTIVRLLEGGQGFSFRFLNLSDESKASILKYLENAE